MKPFNFFYIGSKIYDYVEKVNKEYEEENVSKIYQTRTICLNTISSNYVTISLSNYNSNMWRSEQGNDEFLTIYKNGTFNLTLKKGTEESLSKFTHFIAFVLQEIEIYKAMHGEETEDNKDE